MYNLSKEDALSGIAAESVCRVDGIFPCTNSNATSQYMFDDGDYAPPSLSASPLHVPRINPSMPPLKTSEAYKHCAPCTGPAMANDAGVSSEQCHRVGRGFGPVPVVVPENKELNLDNDKDVGERDEGAAEGDFERGGDFTNQSISSVLAVELDAAVVVMVVVGLPLRWGRCRWWLGNPVAVVVLVLN
ncbi:hypothetical protein JHK84_035568 [Glycine max]|nr:hypothetical protein JHK84_035568 [Glycine max]